MRQRSHLKILLLISFDDTRPMRHRSHTSVVPYSHLVNSASDPSWPYNLWGNVKRNYGSIVQLLHSWRRNRQSSERKTSTRPLWCCRAAKQNSRLISSILVVQKTGRARIEVNVLVHQVKVTGFGLRLIGFQPSSSRMQCAPITFYRASPRVDFKK